MRTRRLIFDILGVAALVTGIQCTSGPTRAVEAISTNPRSCIRVVALDLDGTLLSSDGTVSEVTVRALARFVNGGGRAVIASGRGLEYCIEVAASLGKRGLDVSGLVVSDGGLVLGRSKASWDEVLHCSMPSGATVGPMVDQLLLTIPECSFAADIAGTGVIISCPQYIELIRKFNPPFFDKFMRSRAHTPDLTNDFATQNTWLG
mmetsp:Transcript_42576/g.96380  ORF Transcript_42576/g.96380 Transcript_42576/m.96380 type:complete len:205 (+) Transcript_42576:47-661(+)